MCTNAKTMTGRFPLSKCDYVHQVYTRTGQHVYLDCDQPAIARWQWDDDKVSHVCVVHDKMIEHENKDRKFDVEWRK